MPGLKDVLKALEVDNTEIAVVQETSTSATMTTNATRWNVENYSEALLEKIEKAVELLESRSDQMQKFIEYRSQTEFFANGNQQLMIKAVENASEELNQLMTEMSVNAERELSFS